MGNLLSLTTFIPLLGAAILALFLRGNDEAAQRNAKWVAHCDDSRDLHVSLFILASLIRRTPAFRWSRSVLGFWA